MNVTALDNGMMRRCIEMSAAAAGRGELPFACIIVKDGRILAEAMQQVVQDGDVTRHAELVAISAAQKALGRADLSGCTLYSNVEPCPMCSFPVRETRIGRVVFAISSPMMGGLSKWNVLGDNELSNVMPQAFGDLPEIVGGVMYREAAAVWQQWNPVVWLAIRYRGVLAAAPRDEAPRKLQASRSPLRHRVLRRLLALYR